MKLRRQSGLSLVETMIAAATTVLVALGVAGVVSGSRGGAEVVRKETKRSEALRDATVLLARELKQTNSAHLTITNGADNNHIARFQTALSVTAGAVTWGVRNAVPGNTEADRERANWSIQYRVLPANTTAGPERRLVREVLDAADAVQKRVILARRVLDGNGPTPGFQVTPNGAMWRVVVGVENASTGDSLAFDIALLN